MGEADVATASRAKPGRELARERFYRQLVERHRASVYSSLRWLCGDDALAADLTAEAYVRVWERWGTIRQPSAARAFLFKVALNEYRRAMRRRGVEVASPGSLPDAQPDPAAEPLRSVEREALRQGVREAVAALPELHRAVVVLHKLEGLKLREVAAMLDIPVGTAKSRLAAAFVMLRRSLREWKEEA